MSALIVIVGIFLIGGIIFLSGQFPVKKKSRDGFLKDLAEFVGGRGSEIPDKRNCFQVCFNFEGQDFVFEDIKEKGFEQMHNKARLKAKTPANLTLSFTEKERSMRVQSDILIMSDIKEEPGKKEIKVRTPKALEKLKIFTDNPRAVNELFEDDKVVKIFKEFTNVDNRGTHSVSLNVANGELILEFHSNESFEPSLAVLQGNIPSMEDYVDKMLIVIKRLRSVENPLL